ncbi:MAG TPA: PH domain-containing protein [Tepidiformaceae bacterium]|nr:PH domain-containing protein [Tepidiformaceae bacterium]
MHRSSTMKRDIRYLEEYLDEGENVRALSRAAMDGKNGVLALTDRRVLVVFHGMLHRKEDELPLEEIKSVECEHGMVLSNVKIGAEHLHQLGNNKKDAERTVYELERAE